MARSGFPSSRLDEAIRRRHKRRNLLQSLVLLVAMAGLLGVCALLLFGPAASLWAALGWLLGMAIAPRIEPGAALALYGARPLPRQAFPNGYDILERLAAQAGLQQLPPLYHLPSPQLNAFTVGRRGEAAIAVTDGLLRQLNAREFAAVMAHEIGHLINNDLWVMNLADSLSRLTRVLGFVGLLLLFLGLPLLLTGEAGPGWLLGAGLLALAPTLAALLQLALSRTREFDADLEAVALTGDPAGLASALTKLERRQRGLWALVTGQGKTQIPSLLRSHPGTTERIERLRSLQGDRERIALWGDELDRPERPSRRRPWERR